MEAVGRRHVEQVPAPVVKDVFGLMNGGLEGVAVAQAVAAAEAFERHGVEGSSQFQAIVQGKANAVPQA